uniref:Uncharacterized protein n=1 Tax=Xiphophorus couchianus TaxID=32473 RepID=A0A3B5L5Q3_9TELE
NSFTQMGSGGKPPNPPAVSTGRFIRIGPQASPCCPIYPFIVTSSPSFPLITFLVYLIPPVFPAPCWVLVESCVYCLQSDLSCYHCESTLPLLSCCSLLCHTAADDINQQSSDLQNEKSAQMWQTKA